MTACTAFAPASVSNVGPGFDVLGFALEEPGDFVTAVPRDQPGVGILDITGDEGRLPRAAERNTAAVAAAALLRETRSAVGVGLVIRKGLPLASGIGSSGASAVAAVCAVNEALRLQAPQGLLLRCAMEGEGAAAGTPHPDNVAPALHGGFVLVRATDPADVVRLPVPPGIACALVRPHVEVRTSHARAILRPEVPLAQAVRQWANVGALVAALYTGDLDLLSRALVDVVVEPQRAHLVPGFGAVQDAARAAGALGCSFSGSGPTIFALCRSRAAADTVAEAMLHALRTHGRIDGTTIVSAVSSRAAHIVDAVD